MKHSRRDFIGRGFAVVGGVAAVALVSGQASAVTTSVTALKPGTDVKAKTIEFERWLVGTVPA